jgi:tRNA(Ile2) C34 agmatinyltransferase TiaS
MEEVQGDDPVMFDQSGNLVLPAGAVEEFRVLRNPKYARYHTGVYVTCPKCGRTWERKTTAGGRRRCNDCRTYTRVDEIAFQ